MYLPVRFLEEVILEVTIVCHGYKDDAGEEEEDAKEDETDAEGTRGTRFGYRANL